MINTMSNNGIKVVQFREEDYPEVIRIGNELADLEERKPHDSVRRLIEDEGQKKIDRLKEEKQKAEV